MIKVFIICSGLGKVNRGFESFTQECFEALSQSPELDITLFKGGGKSADRQISLWNFPRDSWPGIQLGKLTGRGAYFVEQLSFTCSLLFHIMRQQPDVIYFSDGTIGNILWHWRKRTGQQYKLLFSNGGPLSPPFDRCDRVQQVTPTHLQTALQAGEPIERHILVPYGIKMNPQLKVLSTSEKADLRYQLGLPDDLPIVLSVAAINKSHKRMDYLIREVAQLPQPRPYLLMLGQIESESAEIMELANQLLERDQFQIKTVASHQIPDYYQVADAFVLASLGEGFGRVFLEAMAYGLPCLAHDYEVTRFVLMSENYLGDFTVPGNLACLVQQALAEGSANVKRNCRHQIAYKNFSWENLRPAYIKLISHCMN